MDIGGLSPMNGETVVGICEDMCPEEERIRRIQECDAHKLELLPDASNTKWYRGTMIKKLQKSSADHSLQIPEHLRTPETLLKTITYIEEVLMDKSGDPYFTHGDTSSKLVVYLFIWDRYRMIAKDFTLQSTALQVSDLWFECHERMARWMIYMDHFMRTEDEFTKCHAQQNGEQLNNLLKTLHGYYFKDLNNKHRILPNQCEFLGYFVIFQIGNGGEVTKYLQRLPIEILKSKELTFAIAVWTAIRTDNYAKFFQLLKICNPLQKSLLFRYLGEMRLKAIKKILKTNYVQSKSTTVKVTLSLQYFQDILLFDNIEEAKEFFEHCSVTISPSPSNPDDYLVSVEGQNIDQLLPRDANDLPIRPKVPVVMRLMEKALIKDAEGNLFTVQEICRGEFKKLFPSVQSQQPLNTVANTTTPASKVPKNLLNLKIPKKTPQAVVQSPPPFDSPTPQTMNPTGPFPLTVAAAAPPQKNVAPVVPLPKEAKPVVPSAQTNPFSTAKSPAQSVAAPVTSNNPFMKEAAPPAPATAGKQLNIAAKPFVPTVNPFTGAPVPPTAAVNIQAPAVTNTNPFAPAAASAGPASTNPFAKKDAQVAPGTALPQQLGAGNPFAVPPAPTAVAPNATAAKVIPPVPLFQPSPNEMITPVRKASKDFTAEELQSKISPQVPVIIPISRQRSADLQLQQQLKQTPPIPGLQRQKSSEKPIPGVPTLVPETSVASSLSSMSTVTNSKQLPLLSATSIDEFMSRQQSYDGGFPPSLSITHPQDIPSLSRQTSVRTDNSTMSVSPKPFGPTPGAENPLTMSRTLSTSRGPQHAGTPNQPQQSMKRQTSSSLTATTVVESPRLLKLEKEFQKKQLKRRISSVFHQWKELLIQRQLKLEKFYLRKSFRSWLKLYLHAKESRNEFFSSIQSINIQQHQPPSVNTTNQFLVIEPPKSSSSSPAAGGVQLYQPPHARKNNNNNNNIQSPSSFGFKKNQKRRPLRDYSVLPVDAVVGNDHERALSMIDGDYHDVDEDGDDDAHEDDEGMGKADSISKRKGKSSSYRSEGGSSSSSALIAFPSLTVSSSSASSNPHLHMIPSFISSIMSILSLPCYLQQRKQFEQILIDPAITNLKLHQHQNIPHLEQFIADLLPSSSDNTAISLPFSLLNIYSNGLPGHFFPTLTMKESFFQPSNPVLSTLTNFNSHLFCKMFLITPCPEKGLFLNDDDPFLSMFRSSFMNLPGFYSNFTMKDESKFLAHQKKFQKLLKKKNNNQEDDEDEDEDEEEDLSLRFTREERMKILKQFQNFQISSTESDYLLRNKEIFQLGLYENYHLSIHFQQQQEEHPPSSSFSSSLPDVFRNIRALPTPMHFSVSESSLVDCPSASLLEDQHLAVILLSNYYSSSHLHYQLRTYLDRAPNTDFTLLLIVHLPEGGDDDEEEEGHHERGGHHRHHRHEDEVVELPSFPTMNDLHAHYQSRHAHPTTSTSNNKKKSPNKSPATTTSSSSSSKKLTATELDEIQIIHDFLHRSSHSSSMEALSRIRRTLLIKKYSNSIYQQRILPRQSLAPLSSSTTTSSSSSYTVSVPLLQFQLADSQEMIHLQSLFQSFLDSQVSSVLIQEIIPNIIEKKKEKFAPFVRSTKELTIHQSSSSSPNPLSGYYRNEVIQKYYLKDFLAFHLFTSFFKKRDDSSSSSILEKRKFIENDQDDDGDDDGNKPLILPKKGRKDQEGEFFSNLFQSFLSILRHYQQFYYAFMQSLQTTFQSSTPPHRHHHLPEEFSYFQGKIDSFGIMKLSSSFQVDDSAAQYLPAWIPLEWKDHWYLEKCQVFVSNVIYPIEQFLLQSSSKKMKKKNSTNEMINSKESFFLKLDELDALSAFDQPQQQQHQQKSSASSQKKKSFATDGLLTFKETFQALFIALKAAHDDVDEEECDEEDDDGEGIILEKADLMKILHAILVQRFEILYPFLRDHYRKQQHTDGQVSFVNSDFDSLYYCHAIGETKANNPFLLFNFQQSDRLLEQRQSTEKLFASLQRKEKAKKRNVAKNILSPSKQTALMLCDSSAEKEKKNKKRKAVASPAETDNSIHDSFSSAQQQQPGSVVKGEKRRYASLYDTPTIGADWNPSLLQELENNSAVKNQSIALSSTKNEDEASIKKRKKETDLTISSKQKSPVNASRMLPQQSPLALYYQKQQQLQLAPAQPQEELDEKILKEKFENQKKASKNFLDFLQQQIMN